VGLVRDDTVSRSDRGRPPRDLAECPGGQPRTEPEPTGIEYLRLLDTRHDQALRDQISYAALAGPAAGPQGQQEQEGTSRA